MMATVAFMKVLTLVSQVGEMAAASAEGGAVSLARLRAFLPAKRPNYIKAVRVWEEQEKAGLPAMSLTAAAEQAKQFMAAGKEVVSDVSASMAASRDKVSDVFSRWLQGLVVHALDFCCC